MMQALAHLLEVFDCQVFELCGPFEEDGQIVYYVPYMMNDAVEDYLILRNCRMIGEYLSDTELTQEAQIAKDESGYVLAVRQGEQNAFTLYFETIEECVQCYQYHQIGHFWVKGQEHWRQLVYMIGTIHDKHTFLGEAFCNSEEMELLHLVEFAPFREWSPIHGSLEESYPETENGIEAMERLAKEAGDMEFVRWIGRYRRFSLLQRISSKMLLSPRREALYQLIYEKVAEASAKYPERQYSEEAKAQMDKARKAAQAELESRGFQGVYPVFQKEHQKILVTEEHPFTILEWNHYKFKIQFMVSECKGANKLNSGFFKGRGRKGWIEEYDKL